MTPNSDRSTLAWGVVRRIEKQLKIDGHPFTATRYFEGSKASETLPPIMRGSFDVASHRRFGAGERCRPRRARSCGASIRRPTG